MTVVTFGEVQQEETKVVHKIGNYYKHKDGGLYLLCTSAYLKVILVNLALGYFWTSPVIVKDVTNIQEKEMQEISDGEFTLVTHIHIQEA